VEKHGMLISSILFVKNHDMLDPHPVTIGVEYVDDTI
jgi:hypothetical protein